MTTVILTRPVPSIPAAKKAYEKIGFNVFEAPVFDIRTNMSVKPQWLDLKTDVWVVLSVNALDHALKIKPDLQPDENTQIIAVGPAVERAWKNNFNHPITHHPLMNSEGVIELLKEANPKSVKIITTADGRALIKAHCMKNCISYSQINTYVRLPLTVDVDALMLLLDSEKDIVLTATSSDILQTLVDQLPTQILTDILKTRLIVGAKRIEALAEKLGFIDVVLAPSPSDEAMAKAI